MDNIPEYTDTEDIDAVQWWTTIKVQKGTLGHLDILARNMELTRAEAARWTIEIGLESLFNAGLHPGRLNEL